MSDINRLRTAIEKRMELARAAGSTSRPSPRMVGRYADWHAEPYYTSDDEPYSVVLQPPLGQVVPAAMATRIAEHIAANDPATSLRCGEAVLALIREYEQAVQFYERPENRHIPAGEVHGLERAIILLAEAFA